MKIIKTRYVFKDYFEKGLQILISNMTPVEEIIMTHYI
jgi:hypothetical protein